MYHSIDLFDKTDENRPDTSYEFLLTSRHGSDAHKFFWAIVLHQNKAG